MYLFDQLQCQGRRTIYPDAAQRQQLAVEFGNNRFVWNRCLDLRDKDYEAYKAALVAGDVNANKPAWNYVSLARLVTEWKRGEFPWLADSVAACLTQTLIDQDKAFQHFFRRVKAGQKPGYPRFKSRHGKQSIRYTLDQRQIDCHRAGRFEREGHGQEPLSGRRDSGCWHGRVSAANRIQSRVERAERGRGRPLVPEQQDLFGLRFVPVENAAVGAGLDVSRLQNAA